MLLSPRWTRTCIAGLEWSARYRRHCTWAERRLAKGGHCSEGYSETSSGSQEAVRSPRVAPSRRPSRAHRAGGRVSDYRRDVPGRDRHRRTWAGSVPGLVAWCVPATCCPSENGVDAGGRDITWDYQARPMRAVPRSVSMAEARFWRPARQLTNRSSATTGEGP